MIPTLNIGGAVIPTAALITILGAYLTLDATERIANKLGLDGAHWYTIAFNTLLAALLGARAVFVLQNLPAFMRQPISIIWPLTAGYVLWAGLLIGLAVLLWRTRKFGTNALAVLAPVLAIGLGFVALADFFGGAGLGTVTDVPWAIRRVDVARHPVQIYEILVSLIALLTWWRLRLKQGIDLGAIGLITLAVYAAGRLFVDAFRVNTPVVGAGFHLIQIVSLITLLATLFMLASRQPPEKQ